MNHPRSGETERKSLAFSLLARTLFRGFFIQAAWNYENFQGIGFAHGLIPFLRTSGLDKTGRDDVLRRHVGCFNTNPYLSGMILGGVLRLEEQRLEGHVTTEEIETFKNDLMGPLGALGDSFVWGALRPLAGITAVLTSIIFESLAPFLFLILYNSFALWFRASGLKNGYSYGADLLVYLKHLDLQKKISWMNGFILFGLGVLLPLWVSQAIRDLSFAYLGLLGFVAVVVAMLWSAERKGVPLFFQVAALLFLSELWVHLGWLAL